MKNSLLKKLLSNQNLVLSHIQDKLEIVNFIHWGYENSLPTLSSNSFIAFSGLTAYRSLIVDICMLFQENKHQKCNFHLLVDTSKKYVHELEDSTISIINSKLAESKCYFHKQMLDLRNEDIAHYKLREEVSISFNLEYLPELNKLTHIAHQILQAASDGFKDKNHSSHFIVGLNTSWIYGLNDIISKINGVDYYAVWKNGL